MRSLIFGRFSVAFAAALCLAATAACSSSGSGVPSPAPTPVQQQFATVNSFNTPVALPAVANDTSAITIPAASASGSFSVEVSAQPLAGVTIASPPSGPAYTPLLYVELTPSADTTLSGFFGFTFGIPGASSNQDYYLAFADPGVQAGAPQMFYAGPAAVSAASVSFSTGQTPMTLKAGTKYGIVLFSVPLPPGSLAASPSSVSLTSVGETAQSTVSESGYSGVFTASATDSTVATAAIVGNTLTITANAAGSTTVNVRDTYGQTVTIDVGVTTSGVIIQSRPNGNR